MLQAVKKDSKKSSKLVSKHLVNKEMNQETYKLRREVMNLIYEAKQLVPNLPRIEVRITEDHPRYLGMGRMGECIVWITQSVVQTSDLRTVVFHEILHAAYSVEHDEKCPLMKPILSNLSKEECHRLFLKWVTRSIN